MRLIALALLIYPSIVFGQAGAEPSVAELTACALAPPSDSLVHAVIGLDPPKRSRYFCAQTDVTMAATDAPISSHILPPGQGAEWRYTFFAPGGYSPPGTGLVCEDDTQALRPTLDGLTSQVQICRGTYTAPNGIWVFALQYTSFHQAETGEAMATRGILVVGHRKAVDG